MLWHKIQGAGGVSGEVSAGTVATATTTPNNGSTFVNITATAASGADDYIAFLTSDLSLSGFADANYTQLYYASAFNGSSTVYIGASATDNAFTASSVSLACLAVVPITGGSHVSTGFTQLSTTSPSASVTSGDLILVVLFGQDIAQGTETATPPSGYTLIGVASAYDPGLPAGASSFIWVAAKTSTASGTETPAAWTTNLSGIQVHGSGTVVLR